MVRKSTGRLHVWAMVGVLIGALLLAIALAPVSQAASPCGLALAWRSPVAWPPTARRPCWLWKSGATRSTRTAVSFGRPVEFVYYDDQTKPASVPGIYTKLLDVDKVDFVVSGYGTNLIAPAMPIVIERNLVFMGLFGLANNEKFNYPYYFQIGPNGPEPAREFSRAFFDLAATAKSQTAHGCPGRR